MGSKLPGRIDLVAEAIDQSVRLIYIIHIIGKGLLEIIVDPLGFIRRFRIHANQESDCAGALVLVLLTGYLDRQHGQGYFKVISHQGCHIFTAGSALLIRCDLDYVTGSNRVLENLVAGQWKTQFLVLEKGHTVKETDFFPAGEPERRLLY